MCLTAGSDHCLTIQASVVEPCIEEYEKENHNSEGYEVQNDPDDFEEENDSEEEDAFEEENIFEEENDLDESVTKDDSDDSVDKDDSDNSEAQDDCDDSEENEINNDYDLAQELMEKYDKLEIVVKHMKDFNKHLVGKNINHNDKLQNFILKADPKFNMIILPWNYSFNGDVCMALRKDFILSKMVLEAEMRQIGVASNKVSLNTIQTKVLKKSSKCKH